MGGCCGDECENINQVLNQPIYLNPKICENGKTLYNKLFIQAGIKQIKDISYEYITGFLPDRAISDGIVDIGKTKVINECNRVKQSLPTNWVKCIENETVRVGEDGLPPLYVDIFKEKKYLSETNVKTMYNVLVGKEIKRPASESTWEKIFPEIDVKSIWTNLNIKYNNIECENLNFKLRHTYIYINVVIHQINRNTGKQCDVCKKDAETQVHLFAECEELKPFQEKIKDMVKKRIGISTKKKKSGKEY